MLRQVYGTVITEPVPDRFSALLNQLASAAPAEPPEDSAAAPAEGAKTHAERAENGERA